MGKKTSAGFTLAVWVFGIFGIANFPNRGIVDAVFYVLTNRWWQIVAFAPNILVLWRVSFRLNEPRPWDRN
ncbi:MAG TPA: hypothetical protein VE422_42585 [Terriglobia bacterium]|nr:hypothetical protein [Terriglobia bacterium]